MVFGVFPGFFSDSKIKHPFLRFSLIFRVAVSLKAVIHRPFRTADLASYGDRA